jgi:protein-S-isoprenylcysteine O-methyltransferase Ste14
MNMTEQTKDHADVKFHPPVLMAIHLAAALVLGWLVPLPLPVPKFVNVAGMTMVIVGLVAAFGALRQMIQAHTSPDPHSPTTSVVTTGVYRFTRNPIYVGYLCVLIGIPLIFGNYWGVILSPLQVILFNRLIIQHEEAYLSEKFGQEYLDYKARVWRWI